MHYDVGVRPETPSDVQLELSHAILWARRLGSSTVWICMPGPGLHEGAEAKAGERVGVQSTGVHPRRGRGCAQGGGGEGLGDSQADQLTAVQAGAYPFQGTTSICQVVVRQQQ